MGAQTVPGAQMPMHFVLAGCPGNCRAPRKCRAALPTSVTMLATMIAAPAASAPMQRRGRQFGFIMGTGFGAPARSRRMCWR
ncbi:hypothetical protein GE300_06500 [Rhodobacteraceae bacterium 2CG4]|uniref:Uncharacterized protein n=1 Tax=Halovulum marinum TaxID=2662447 RepID=A0A6L5YYZ6_9RHOB|nr:hypothetical protein [Halovulum marinum]MSU89269.1 hypothetical protein [Halovulum marinum]